MVEAYLRRSPLSHRGLAAKATADAPGADIHADILMGERPHRLQINLRGDGGDAALTTALHSVTGLRLPAEANSFTNAGDLACLWLGPNEWLILGPGGGEIEITSRLRGALGSAHAAVTDVSEAHTMLTVAGPRARELLAKGISLDLHPRRFGPGACAQTGLAGANIILRLTGEDRAGGPSFEILVLNSFAEHLWQWLEGAAREYKVAVVA